MINLSDVKIQRILMVWQMVKSILHIFLYEHKTTNIKHNSCFLFLFALTVPFITDNFTSQYQIRTHFSLTFTVQE